MIVEEASALKIGRAYHAAVVVDGHHLGVVEAAVEEEHVDASLGELVAHTLVAFGSELQPYGAKREEILYRKFVANCKANPVVCLHGTEIRSIDLPNSKTY